MVRKTEPDLEGEMSRVGEVYVNDGAGERVRVQCGDYILASQKKGYKGVC